MICKVKEAGNQDVPWRVRLKHGLPPAIAVGQDAWVLFALGIGWRILGEQKVRQIVETADLLPRPGVSHPAE